MTQQFAKRSRKEGKVYTLRGFYAVHHWTECTFPYNTEPGGYIDVYDHAEVERSFRREGQLWKGAR